MEQLKKPIGRFVREIKAKDNHMLKHREFEELTKKMRTLNEIVLILVFIETIFRFVYLVTIVRFSSHNFYLG